MEREKIKAIDGIKNCKIKYTRKCVCRIDSKKKKQNLTQMKIERKVWRDQPQVEKNKIKQH